MADPVIQIVDCNEQHVWLFDRLHWWNAGCYASDEQNCCPADQVYFNIEDQVIKSVVESSFFHTRGAAIVKSVPGMAALCKVTPGGQGAEEGLNRGKPPDDQFETGMPRQKGLRKISLDNAVALYFTYIRRLISLNK